MSEYIMTHLLEKTLKIGFGHFGGVSAKTTVAITPTSTSVMFFQVMAIADAVVAAQANVAGSSNPDLTAYTKISVGTPIYGRWTSLTLASGEIVAYQAPLE